MADKTKEDLPKADYKRRLAEGLFYTNRRGRWGEAARRRRLTREPNVQPAEAELEGNDTCAKRKRIEMRLYTANECKQKQPNKTRGFTLAKATGLEPSSLNVWVYFIQVNAIFRLFPKNPSGLAFCMLL